MNCNSQNFSQLMTQSGCQVQPIVMPTQVVTRQRVSFCEQPIICPVECRTVNRVILVPRYYRAYMNTTTTNTTNNMNCPNQQ